MVRKTLSLMLVAGTFAIAACSTVKGAGEDIKSVAECTEEMMNRGEC